MAAMTLAGADGTGRARLGVVLRDPLPWEDLRQLAATAEETAYEAVFVPEISAREAFATLAALATVTERVRLGTGVVPLPSRSLEVLAMGASTLQELSGGRAILGLGSGSPAGGAPLDLVRRSVEVLRRALAGEAVEQDAAGGGFTLGLEAPAPPIWVGALGDGMVRLAGEVADGMVLNWCTPERVARAAPLARDAADRAGRDPDAFTVAVYVRACLGVGEAIALEALRPMAAQYAAIDHYRRQFERMGLGAEAASAARAFASGRPGDVPERLVRAVAVVGGRRDALEAFDRHREAGADLVLCYPVVALDPFSSVLGTMLAAAPSPAVEA